MLLRSKRRHAAVHRQPLDLEQAVLAAGDAVRLDGDEPEHLAEGDGHQRVVDAAPVRDEERDEAPATAAASVATARQSHRLGSDIELREAERIGADTEEGAVSERGQAGMAEHQIVGQRIGGEDQDLDAEILVEADPLDP